MWFMRMSGNDEATSTLRELNNRLQLNLQGNLGDPLYLSNSDHPGAQLTTVLFGGSNFLSWSKAAETALGSNQTLGFITGTCAQSDEVVNPIDSAKWIWAAQISSHMNYAGKISVSTVNSVHRDESMIDWIVDTGASDHMVGDSTLLHGLVKLGKPIHIGLPDGSVQTVTESGNLFLTDSIELCDVLYVPGFKHNLLSIIKLLCSYDLRAIFDLHNWCLEDRGSNKVVLEGTSKDGLYKAMLPVYKGLKKSFLIKDVTRETRRMHSVNISASNFDKLSMSLVHARLGHSSLSTLKHLFSFDQSIDHFCETCSLAKHHNLPFVRSTNMARSVFEMVHVDLWGPYKTPSLYGDRYFLTLVDDFSRGTWTFLLKDKMQVYRILSDFLAYVNTQFNTQVKCIRSDNGTEIVQGQCRDLFASKGIVHQKSAPYTPQQNGRVERKHRQIVETARALRLHSNLPIKFWGDCVLAATHIINKLPSAVLNWETPYERLFHQKPKYDELKVIGCLCFANPSPNIKDKFSARATKCVLLGYPHAQKAYKLYDLTTHTVFVSRNVTFQEGILPFKMPVNILAAPVEITQHSLPLVNPANDLQEETFLMPTQINHENSPAEVLSPTPSTPSSSDSNDTNSHVSLLSPQHNSTPLDDHSEFPPLRRSSRVPIQPVKFRDYVVRKDKSPPSLSQAFLAHSLGDVSLFDKEFVDSYALMASVTEPARFSQAKTDPMWVAAMNSELEALEHNKTWIMTTLPPNKTAIGSRWVYKIKYKPDGSVERYKARLVAKGYNQVKDKDYKHTFSPVAKLTTVRTLLALATTKNWPLHQLDVNNAFLHGFLDEEVYMLPPEGYPAPPGEVCRLRKSLYGLKQASRQWNTELTRFLFKCGFKQSKQDYSLFTKSVSKGIVAALVYVDDLLLCGDDENEIKSLKTSLHAAFTIKDLGLARYFLGMEIARSPYGTLIHQRKYVLDILQDCQMQDCKPSPFPLPRGLKLSTDQGAPITDPERYRRLVGRLLFLNLTRPDISYAVQHLSQFMSDPREPHMDAALHVIRYLKGSVSLGLYYTAKSSLHLSAYSDADWGTCVFSARSLTGYCAFLGTSLVSWKTKKQKTVSKSSAESEYRAMSATTSELVWLHGLLADLHTGIPLPIPLYCDNKAAQYIAANPVFHERTKHLRIDCHFIRDKVQEGFVCTSHVSSNLQLADVLTKPLGEAQHHFLISKLGLIDPSMCPT